MLVHGQHKQTRTFDVKKSCEAQTALCKEKDYPHFAPMDGRCYNCNYNIYAEINHGNGYKSGHSFERASTELITGCPHCHISYCE